jgi:transcriptional regulator with XRE-family HTH domain
MKLGDRISKRRKEKGISQEQLADIMNVSRQSVSLWENNQTIPTMEKLLQLSDVLGVSMNFLVGNESDFEETILPITKSKTLLDMKLMDEFLKVSLKKMRTITFIVSVVLGVVLINLLLSNYSDKFYGLFITVLLESSFLIRFYRTKKKFRDSAIRDLMMDQDKEYGLDFYNDYVNISIKSQRTDSKMRLGYKVFSKVIETENYYFLIDNGRYYPVSKNSLQGNIESLRNLLRSNVTSFESPVEKIDNRHPVMSIKHLGNLKLLSTLLFALSFFTLPLALIVVQIYSQFLPDYSNFSFVENLWIMIVVLPLPVASIIAGIIMKKNGLKGTKNIVIGAIMGGLLIIYSSFTLIFGSYISHDYQYVDQIEKAIDFELPNQGLVTTQYFPNESDTNSPKSAYESDVSFSDSEEIASLENRIKASPLWTENVDTKNIGMLSDLASFFISGHDHFMIYNGDLNTYNELPAASGTYHMIFLAYDSSDKTMKIIEYVIKLTIN